MSDLERLSVRPGPAANSRTLGIAPVLLTLLVVALIVRLLPSGARIVLALVFLLVLGLLLWSPPVTVGIAILLFAWRRLGGEARRLLRRGQ